MITLSFYISMLALNTHEVGVERNTGRYGVITPRLVVLWAYSSCGDAHEVTIETRYTAS